MKHLTIQNFDEAIANGTVLVDFWAPWCAPCRMQGMILEEMEADGFGATIAKINVDEEPALAQAFGVMSIPTLVLFKNGKQVTKVVGLRQKDELEELISQN